MADISDTENKPCSVQARQGFSVYYRNRYLYSQYDAEKPVTRLIDSLTILPETLILAYSPVLGTGLLHLLERLPAGCFVLAAEFDRQLYDFFLNTDTAKTACKDPRFKAVLLDRPEQIAGLLSRNRLQAASEGGIPPQGSFRRCLTVEMSGGVAFSQDAYRLTTKYADDSIATFWKNHITLTRLGRLYARNLLTNTAQLSSQMHRTSGNTHAPHCILRPHSVNKPILALGAGPSLDELLPILSDARNLFFILAADAALPSLAQYGIHPDAVVAVESQIAIEKAYIGFGGCGIPLIADLTSRPRVLSIMNGPVSFFMTEYCNEPFMKRFRQFASDSEIPVFPPLGSVGLYTLELALYLRSPETPVIFSGLDFAWGKGSTHCKGAPAHTNILLQSSRLNPPACTASSFGTGTQCFSGKDGSIQYTTPNLAGYGRLLSERYAKTPKLYDAGSTGMETGITRISIKNVLSDAKNSTLNASSTYFNEISWLKADIGVYDTISRSTPVETARLMANADKLISSEYTGIKLIHDLIDEYETALSDSESDIADITGNKLLELLENHSYLFLHFPDAARGPSLSQDFLARIKTECVRFLK